MRRYAHSLHQRSRSLVRVLQARMEMLILLWLALFCAAAAWRIAGAPFPFDNALAFAEVFVAYGLIALAPVAGYRLAMAVYPPGLLPARTTFRLWPWGRWRRIDAIRARAHPAFGPFGFMASLMVGMLLNIPVRSFEFVLLIPAVNGHAPDWGVTMFRMLALDIIAMNFLYAVCFAMALRTAPLFPRMLVFAWGMDVMLQLAIARQMGAHADLPPQIAAPLEDLLRGNVTKVLVSAAIWVPYLLLSQRVNVTYRGRIAP
jgi:hypothetical protein